MLAKLKAIAAAVRAVSGRTPTDIVTAFAPVSPTLGAVKLRPVTMGTVINLERLENPLAALFSSGSMEPLELSTWETLTALFAMSRDSREVERLIAEGTVKEAIHAMAEEASIIDPAAAVGVLMAHIELAAATALSMKSTHGTQKKTAASGGG